MKSFFYLLLFVAFFFVISGLSAQSSISSLKELDLENVPKSLIFKGKTTEAYTFSDIEGKHLILVAETGELQKSKSSDAKEMELYVHHFLQKEKEWVEIWKAQDFVRECEFDLVLGIRPESMEITDLDKDGIAEISFAYYLTCTSDVSPYTMKLLLYEGANKYALRGTAKVMDIESKFTIDSAFKTAPKSFLDFAKEKWHLFEDQAAG